MNIKMRTRRARAILAGTVLASVISVGAVADSASAEEAGSAEARIVNVQLDDGGSHTYMRGGIRW